MRYAFTCVVPVLTFALCRFSRRGPKPLLYEMKRGLWKGQATWSAFLSLRSSLTNPNIQIQNTNAACTELRRDTREQEKALWDWFQWCWMLKFRINILTWLPCRCWSGKGLRERSCVTKCAHEALKGEGNQNKTRHWLLIFWSYTAFIGKFALQKQGFGRILNRGRLFW